MKSITLENAFDNPASEWELRHILSAGNNFVFLYTLKHNWKYIWCKFASVIFSSFIVKKLILLYYFLGSLLGKSCQGALKLAGHPPEMQRHAYLFGRHLALAWQACIDLEPFQVLK